MLKLKVVYIYLYRSTSFMITNNNYNIITNYSYRILIITTT